MTPILLSIGSMSGTPPVDRGAGRPKFAIVSRSDPAAGAFQLPSALADLPWRPAGLRPGRSGRRRQALLIDAALPQPDADASAMPALARAMRALGYQVSFCPVDGAVACVDDELGGSALAQAGAACLGLPAYRSVEEVLRRHAGVFDIVVLQGGGLARAYEPLVRLHCSEARVLFSAGPLAHLRPPGMQDDPALFRATRTAQRCEMLAAYVCDATLVPSEHEAEVLRTALPGRAVHVMPLACAGTPALETALHAALNLGLRPGLERPPQRSLAAL